MLRCKVGITYNLRWILITNPNRSIHHQLPPLNCFCGQISYVYLSPLPLNRLQCLCFLFSFSPVSIHSQLQLSLLLVPKMPCFCQILKIDPLIINFLANTDPVCTTLQTLHHYFGPIFCLQMCLGSKSSQSLNFFRFKRSMVDQ